MTSMPSNSVNQLASQFSKLSLKPPSKNTSKNTTKNTRSSPPVRRRRPGPAVSHTRKSLVNLPPDLLDFISRTHTLSTQNIHAMRRAHRNLTRNVAPRNTNKAASKIAAHGRGMANRKYAMTVAQKEIDVARKEIDFWVRRRIRAEQLRDYYERKTAFLQSLIASGVEVGV